MTPLKLFAASLLWGCFVFQYLLATELILNSWLFKKLHCTKVLWFFATYAIVGVLFGAAIGVLCVFLGRLGRNTGATGARPFFAAVGPAAFICFLAVVALNAHYLPYASMVSPTSLLLNAFLVALCIPLVLYLYASAGKLESSASTVLAMSIGSSIAAAMIVFHVFVSRAVGNGELGTVGAVGLSFLFLLCGAAAAVVDVKATAIYGKNMKDNPGRAPLHILIAKIVLAAVVLSLITLARSYRPLIVKSEHRQSRPASGPNIIILVLDTVRQDRLSPYGCERDTSPNISRFARESLVFDAYSPASWTLPAHAAIVTGLYPTESGTGPGRNYRIDPRNETLAEILREAGYSTAAVISNHLVLDHSSGFAQGFDYYYANPRETDPAFSFFASYFLRKFFPASTVLKSYGVRRAGSIHTIALRWIKKQQHAPFFLFLNYMEAHAPYAAPPPHDRRWFDGIPPATFFGLDGIWREFNKDVNAGKREVTEAERKYLLSQYDGEIAYLDSQIGLFLGELKRLGVYDNSLIVLTSDHGELFAEHGLVQHPRVLYQELIRVPLIVKPPSGAGAASARVPGAVSIVHLFHSLLAHAGVSHETIRDGTNIFETKESPIFSETHSISGESSPEFRERFGDYLYSVIRNDYKLVYSSRQTYELFHIGRDPGEKHNLLANGATQDDERALTRMKGELAAWIEKINANRLTSPELSREADADIRARLKALGYIQ